MPIDKNESFTGLILVSGQDRPGITQSLMSTLSEFAVNILDIEQLVIRDRLLLTVLITLDEAHAAAIASDLDLLQDKLQLDIAIDFVQTNINEDASDNLRVVIVGSEIKPVGLSAVASEIARLGGNITAIKRTARNPVIAIEMNLTIPNDSIKKVQEALTSVAINNHIDLAVEPGGSLRRSKRIVILDMDSTLIGQEVIDLLANHSGKSEAVSELTRKAMNGEIDFKSALVERVAQLKGLPENILEVVRKEITFTKGAKVLIAELHKQGHKVGVVSGGFINVIEPLLKELNVDFFRANKLETANGQLTGKLEGPVIDAAAKREALEEFAKQENVSLDQTVAIGDGANDLEMIKTAGLGIAFNAKPKVAASANTTLNTADLSAVLLLMGIYI